MASAGHPPPLLVQANGAAAQFLERAGGPPVGIVPAVDYHTATHDLAPCSSLLLYTDGLVERRGELLSDGMERLRRTAAGTCGALDQLLDHLVEQLVGSGVADDVALLALRWTPDRSTRHPPSGAFEGEPGAVDRHLIEPAADELQTDR